MYIFIGMSTLIFWTSIFFGTVFSEGFLERIYGGFLRRTPEGVLEGKFSDKSTEKFYRNPWKNLGRNPWRHFWRNFWKKNLEGSLRNNFKRNLQKNPQRSFFERVQKKFKVNSHLNSERTCTGIMWEFPPEISGNFHWIPESCS